jgi:aspartyl-tRNA(Asn)/glutamyl-tRNA(Gln) amidotransferase subunit A
MYKTIADIKKALSSGQTVSSILEDHIRLIKEKSSLNAFVEVFEDSSLENARLIDEKIKLGKAGKLAGVILGIKDNICYKDHKVSAASKILNNFESIYTATVLQKLIDEDAVVIGRLNCDEFAMGSSNENSCYGNVNNNFNEDYVPGGSSGGSAVAVSAGLCTIALGSDTGGSVRQPASWTNTFGLKPTYGSLSRYGLIAYASSFDQIGVFSNSIEDSELVFEITRGKDPMDSTSSSRNIEGGATNPKKIRIGVVKEYMNHQGIDAEIATKFDALKSSLDSDSIEVVECEFPYLEHLVPTYYVLSTAEASSNLSRFDGVHYGHRSTNAAGVEDTYKKSRSEGFGNEVKRRIMTGTFVLSHGYYDAYYTKAQRVRRMVKNVTDAFFEDVDVLLLPTTPSTAFKQGSVNDPITMYLQDIFTVHANLTGNPAISIPFGMHSNGMPFGIQIMSDRFNEKQLFSYSKLLKNYF